MSFTPTSHERVTPSSVPYRGPEWHRACATDYREMSAYSADFARNDARSPEGILLALGRVKRWRDGFREHMREARRLERQAHPPSSIGEKT
jgi:hypothetical protein